MKKYGFLLILTALLPVMATAQADKKLIDKAHQGDVVAMVRLGECYENGAGVQHDSTLALQWFQKAADLGDGEAWLRIARYYMKGTLLPKDTARAFAIRKEWADKGLGNAIAVLGQCYEYGDGCKADTAKALELYREAYKKGTPWGYYCMGMTAMYGLGDIAADKKLAVRCLEKAKKAGDVDAIFVLARYYMFSGDTKKGWKYINEGMKWCDPDVVSLAAECYFAGIGVEMDEAKAQHLLDSLVKEHPTLRYTQSLAGLYYMYPDNPGLRDSAKAIQYWLDGDAFGSSFCRLRLGRFYSEQEQYDQAMPLFRKVALSTRPADNQAEGCYLMGVMHYNGFGCKPDVDSTIYWLKRGADQYKDASCAMFLASIYESDEHKDMPQAVKYYRFADQNGDTTALANLGRLYATNGNVDRAIECYQQMIDKGQADGYYYMGLLYDQAGDGKKCNEIMAKGDKKGSKLCAEVLGSVYEFGFDDTKIDTKKAAKYYERSATPKSLYRLGLFYLNGEIGKQKPADIEKGLSLVSQSADQGFIDAIYTMGYCYETGRYVDTVDHYKAVSYFQQLADNDVPAGQFKMGLYYELGDGGIEADSSKAIDYYQKAAAQGHGEAMCYLGDFYRIGQYLPLDKAKAFELYSQAHEAGEEMGTYYVGRSYLEGCGVEIDTIAAIPYLKAAAAQGVGNAAYKVADIYNFGRAGVPADGDTALAYYVSGHENGSGDASYFLGRLLLNQENFESAFQYFAVAAQRGNVDGIITFAVMLQRGVGTNEADPATAYKIFENAARQFGDHRAYCQLGIACLQGNGCPEDEALGKAYLDTAANLGNTLAMYDLGLCHLNGFGCVPDTALAIAWLEKAADNENIDAINTLGDVYEAQGDFKNAVLYYEKAITYGSLDGYCNLGYCYEQGQGVVLNSQKAYEHYLYAAEHGSTRGCMMVANCYIHGIYVEESVAKALEWYTKAAEGGNVLGMYYCAAILENGDEGVPANKKQAKKWYKMAADAGYDPAAAALSRMK